MNALSPWHMELVPWAAARQDKNQHNPDPFKRKMNVEREREHTYTRCGLVRVQA